ncbi:hypothetical protein QEH52_00390 [Coraliomargarita sp. SDUM461003]|uniref:PEP-CTERM protein-sorting domain-containing protein n=1 Tax=Thalassobacterium maritimum TaxID=3041265 RepID=A0ABU1AP67_9BACT|nr:hypothetical protein [Coraliomargarita sp. SDUM461003]MDQ8205951.1 hypothetical protein [Coraliomargarita sp. SDUM461003]
MDKFKNGRIKITFILYLHKICLILRYVIPQVISICFRFFMKYLCLASTLCVGVSVHAAIDLDFGSVDLQSTLTSDGVMSYGVVSSYEDNGVSDIYAQISAINSYSEGSGGSGGAAGDVRINQIGNTTTTYKLSLFQDAGYTELFDPGSSFSFDLFFYDVDGFSSPSGIKSDSEAATATYYDTYYDVITVYTASSYELTTSSRLLLSQDSSTGALTVSGQDSGGVAGQEGLTSFAQYQADVAISFTFTDQAEVLFDYQVVDNRPGSNSNRNLLFDGNNLSFDGFTTTEGTVPEPSVFAVIAGLCGFATALGRRRHLV